MHPDEHLRHEGSMAKHLTLGTAGGRAWLADHLIEHDAELTERVRQQVAADTRERVLRELGFHDDAGLPVQHREHNVYVVTPHLPTLRLVAHQMDKLTEAVDDDGEHPYEEMAPDEALANVISGIQSLIEVTTDPSQVVNPEDLLVLPFTYVHEWHHDSPSYEHLGQTVQVCLCGERRTMYASEPCNCAHNDLGRVTDNSGTCVVHPLPGCPNPACGDTWIATFHGDHCDSCGWTSPDGTSIVDMPARALAWAHAVFPKGRPHGLPHWSTWVAPHCTSRPAHPDPSLRAAPETSTP